MEWNPNMDEAPRDGTPIQAQIWAHGSDNIIAWHSGLVNSDGSDCGGWLYMEGEPPDSWSDGICWDVNEDGEQSAQPLAWKFPAPPEEG